MGKSVDRFNSKNYQLTAASEIVQPGKGEDGYAYSITHVKAKLGALATVHGRVFRALERPDDSIKATLHNGFMATSHVYDEVAAEMTRESGATTAVYDTWHPLTLKDLQDPLLIASMGGHRMIDIMEEMTDDDTEEVAAIGHSMGGLSSSRLAAYDPRVTYWVGDASAGIETEGMLQVHIDNMPDILRDEALPLGRQIMQKTGAKALALDYAKRFGLNPTQVVRQAIILCKNPDISPYLAEAKQRGVMTGVMLHEHDRFFHKQKQLDAINSKRELFDHVEEIADTYHVHSNMEPHQNAIIRMDVIRQLRSKRLAGSVLRAAVGH